MNGVPLAVHHGFPLRLIAPGWFGIANVKWLKRIEVIDSRFMGRFMAKDYVTLREEKRDSETVWNMTSVGRALVKSVAAKVTKEGSGYRIHGAAWGAPIERVEVRVDAGDWRRATIGEGKDEAFAWKFWHSTGRAPPGIATTSSRGRRYLGKVNRRWTTRFSREKTTGRATAGSRAGSSGLKARHAKASPTIRRPREERARRRQLR
jgi:DMSO/TMAO reductase YedYZ molybdopterin-dependent catalytic subunit